ncbi:hypothetical protein CHUAL_003302 [Chamberlinius hualienensis]
MMESFVGQTLSDCPSRLDVDYKDCEMKFENINELKAWLDNLLNTHISVVEAPNETASTLCTVLSFATGSVSSEINCKLISRIYEWMLDIADNIEEIRHLEERDVVLHSCVRLLLTYEQRFYCDWIKLRCVGREDDVKESKLFQFLNRIIINLNYSSRTRHLGGIALAFFLQSFVNISKIVKAYLLQYTLKFNERCWMFGDGQICLLHGWLVSGKNDVLLSSSESEQPFIMELLPVLLYFCHDKRTNAYHSFTTLTVWLKYVEKNIKQLCDLLPITFDVGSNGPMQIFECLNMNWTNPTVGVGSLIGQCYRTLIDIHIGECAYRNISGSLIEVLLKNVMEESWTAKSKYPQLSFLIKHIEFENILKSYPAILSNLSLSLASNLLASASSDVYNIILKKFARENHHLSETDLIEIWSSMFLPPLLSGLCNSNSIIRTNVSRYYLVYTLKVLPSTFHRLCCTFEETKLPESYLALATTYHLARNVGICSPHTVNVNSLLFCLNHSEESVRAEAFSFLCQSNKKAELLSDLEIELIRDFLPLNLNIDDAGFRHQLLSSFKLLLIRLRDSCLGLFKLVRQKTLNEAEMNKTIDFLDWLLRIIVTNLNYGGCYQRRLTCLHMLSYVLKVWCSSPVKKSRKDFVPAATPRLLDYLYSKGKCLFLSPDVQRSLMICIVDYMDEIKELSMSILKQHFYKNMLEICNMHSLALKLSSSPKTMHCDSGALMFVLLFRKRADFNDKIQMVEELVNLLINQFKLAKENMLQASTDTPIHGIVSSLKKIFQEISVVFADDEIHMWKDIISQIVNQICEIISYILSVLAGNAKSVSTPSFAEMGEAVENLISSSDRENKCESKLTKEYHLILSCCWLTLKECCLLLGEFVKLFPLELVGNGFYLISEQQVLLIGSVFTTVLLRCRHRGVIESSCLGFEMYCRKLLVSGVKYYNVVLNLLEKMIEDVISIATTTSTTRRSAGFPAYILSIVTSESQGDKKLIRYTLKSLLEIVDLPLDSQIDHVVDVPQAHALHILKALVHDARSSSDIFYQLDNVFIVCLRCFSSPSWAIRNAAVQLYGTVAQRLLGQKQVSDDSSTYNYVSMEDFFMKWPTLEKFLLGQLENIDFKSPSSIVFPILAVLGRLSPSSQCSDVSRMRNEKFIERIFPLLGCPIWHIRKMAAQSIQAMITPANITKHYLVLMKNVTENVGGWNMVHGALYCLKLMMQVFQEWRNVKFETSSEYVGSCCMLIITSERVPDIVRVLAVDIIKTIPNALKDTAHSINLRKSLLDSQLHYWKLQLAIENSGAFSLSDLIHPSLKTDELLAVIQFFNDQLLRCQDEKLYTFWNEVQNLLVMCLSVTMDVAILLGLLQLLLSIYNRTKRTFNEINSKIVADICHQLSTTGQSGALVAATSVAIWAIALKFDISERKTNSYSDIKVWTSLVVKHSSPCLYEDYRLLSTSALNICGAETMLFLLSTNVVNETAIVDILDATFNLLQDEQMQVRKEVTCFVCKLASNKLTKDWTGATVHPNLAIKILSEYICSRLSNIKGVYDYLWAKIGGSSDIKTIYNQLLEEDIMVSLFEQEDVNVYAEKCFISQVYCDTLKTMLKKTNTNRDWTSDKIDYVLRMTQIAIDKWDVLDPIIGSLQVGLQTKILPHLFNLYRQLSVINETTNEKQRDKELLTRLHSQLGSILNYRSI